MKNILQGPALPANFWNGLNQSVGNYILDYIRQHDDRVFMINGETNEQLKLSELSERSINVAAYLQSLGCCAGTRVAIYSENHINYFVAQLGVFLSGATVATLNHLYTSDEMKHAVSIVKPIVLFCSLYNYAVAKVIQENNPFIKHLILLEDPPVPVLDILLLSDMVKKSNRKLIEQPYDPNATASILFSSGTTGLPKGVMQTNKNILYILQVTKIYDLFQLQGKYTLCTLPMFHGYGMFVNLFTLVFDMTLIFLKRFNEELYLSLIEKYKIKSLYLVPPMVVTLLKSDLVGKFDVSSVNHIVCGSATLKLNTEKEIKEKFNLERVQQAYGMTESTLMFTIKRRDNYKTGTCGTLVPGVNGKVVDIETQKLLGPHQTGELCFQTHGMMKGYLDNPQATANTIRDGWLHTGDIGYYDEDGDFFVVDRLKELMKFKGYQVAPAELEALLIEHEEVKDAGVVGIPDEMAGELPKGFVVRKRGSTITEKELQKYVASKVSPQKWLRGGITFVDEIPKNPSGKILRRKLRELSLNHIACKY